MAETSEFENDQSEAGFDLVKSLPAILWARRWLIIIPAVLLSAAGIAAAFLIPPVYQSQATILIESAQLPQDMMQGSVTSMVDQRIERIRQRVLSRGDLIQLIRTNGLYPKEQRTQPLSAIVETMRTSTSIDAVEAEIANARARNAPNTVAFTIAFKYPQPAPAQVVVQQFVNRFLEIDASNQTEQATGAANFIGEQAQDLQNRIREIENQVTQLKVQNGTTLTLGQFGGGNAAGATAQIDSQIDGLMAENGRLAALPSTSGSEVTLLRGQLRDAEARLSAGHPDVIALRARLAAAESAGAGAQIKTPEQIQIESNQARIAALRSARAMAASQSASVQNAASRAPAIMAQIDQLEKQADTLRAQYQQLGGALVSAETSARMESEQKGERFTVADPPVIPDTPISPDRPKLIIGGIAGGIALGLVLAFGVEMLLRPIRGIAALQAVFGAPPLVIIPEIDAASPATGFTRRLRDLVRRLTMRRRVIA